MKIEKIRQPIVCDVLGCGNLADYKMTFDGTGASYNLCRRCFTELKRACAAGDKDERRN